MSAFWTGTVLGLVAGAGLTLAALSGWRWWRRRPEREQEVRLSEADYAALSESFRQHAEAVQAEARRYADTLAEGDVELRERLRTFEPGQAS